MSAISRARMTRCRSPEADTAQPTTNREYRSRMAARIACQSRAELRHEPGRQVGREDGGSTASQAAMDALPAGWYWPRMLKAQPNQRRQLPEDGPLLLWRDADDGGREGLVLLPHACAEPTCTCRDVHLEGLRVSGRLAGVSANDKHATFRYPPGKEEPTRTSFHVVVDIDDGRVSAHEDAARDNDSEAVAWLEGELDSELLAVLRTRFQRAKRSTPCEHRWQSQDWSWWKPGMAVGWGEIDPTGAEDELTLGDDAYVVDDIYCVEPACTCQMVRVGFLRVDESDESYTPIGDVIVDWRTLDSALIDAHGEQRSIVEALWAEYRRHNDLTGMLEKRAARMREIGPELLRLHAERQPRRAVKAPGPNEACSCGSGKKFKKCCGRS